jgi:hypothetical protein
MLSAPLLLTMPAGSLVVFALATWWGGLLSWTRALAVALPAAVCVAVFAAGVLGQVDRLTGSLLLATAVIVLAPSWLAVGGALQRLPDVSDIEGSPLDPVPDHATA